MRAAQDLDLASDASVAAERGVVLRLFADRLPLGHSESAFHDLELTIAKAQTVGAIWTDALRWLSMNVP